MIFRSFSKNGGKFKNENKLSIDEYDDGEFIWSDGIQNNTVRYGEEQDVDDL